MVPVVRDDAEPWIAGASRQFGGRLIGRAIVDDDQLEVREGLGEDAVDGPSDELAAVEHRHQYRDHRPVA